MGLMKRDFETVIAKHGTIGGATYWVDGRATCFRPLSQEGKQDQWCVLRAGFKTDHVGEGACNYHRGGAGAKSVTGRYSHIAKRKLKRQYDEFANDPHMMNLVPELVLQRTLLTEAFEKYQDEMSPAMLKLSLQILGDIAGTVATIEKIQSNQVITAAAARLMMAKAVEVVGRFVEKERMAEFIIVWRDEVQASQFILEG